jgi:hypothetical protein
VARATHHHHAVIGRLVHMCTIVNTATILHGCLLWRGEHIDASGGRRNLGCTLTVIAIAVALEGAVV